MISRLLAQVDSDVVEIVTQDPNLEPITQLKPSFYLSTILNVLLGSAGVFSFIYLLWGGVQWITAGGDKDAIEKARRKILHALIGLLIVFSSYAILNGIRILFNVNLIQLPLRSLPASAVSESSGGSPVPTIAVGYCGCGGASPPNYCASAGDQGPLVFNGNCFLCENDGDWTELPGTAPCPVLICSPCP